MVAFLVTHNAYSSGPRYAVWARNQRYSVRQQLLDGVRGLMLDIYPGWGEAEVTLCHETCFWGGATDLLDTLIVVRKFLENNPREVITIIFEDYLRNPTILKHVFDKAGVSRHVLDSSEWGNVYKNWPTLHEMRRLGRLVVFNNNGLKGFPYTEDNMWFYVRENRYGQPGLDTKTCVDRGESRLNADFSDNWSLVLVNWFGTATNPLNPCLNSFLKMKRKLATCAREFGQRANFVAVDYYESGEHGGAFKAVQWLNDQWKDLYNRHLKQVSGVKGPETRLNSLRYSDKLGSVFKSNYSKGVTLEEVYNDNGFRNSLGFLIPSNITKLISSPKEKDYRNVKGTNNTLGFVESYRDQIGDRDNISEVPKASTSFPDSSTNDYVSGSGEKEHKLNRISLMAALNEMIGTNQVEDTVEELGRNVSSSEHTMKLLRNNSQPHFGTVVARPAEATKKRNVSVNHIVSQNGQGYSNKTQYLTEIIDQI
ncbi:predicted protein [Nematostella vectensis]|uniref:Uncharacterized protein n=1 Tax=Nematostella vectensis TaxID=45351 RepID=A7SHU7_NEMVE|nr:predicted protein [Nematostella vectensis]|eukprot:XP_001628778.1 predicted protein [Nematostella vectensis]